MSDRPILDGNGLAQRRARPEKQKSVAQCQGKLRALREAREAGTIPQTYEAIESLNVILKYLAIEGTSPKTLETKDTIPIPRGVVEVLVDAWQKAAKGQSLDHMFGLKAAGKGNVSALRAAIGRDKGLLLALDVEARIYAGETQNAARQAVAGETRWSFDVVEKAHDAHKTDVRERLRDFGILKAE